MFGWGRRRRARARLLLEGVASNIWQLACLDETSRELLFSYATELLRGTSFEVAGGLTLEDEMRATVVLHLALLGHRLPDWQRPTRLRVILYPDYFSDPQRTHLSVRMGEVGEFGAMALAWRSVLLGGLDPSAINVVVHELAHVLDGLSGDIDGMPLLDDASARTAWRTTLDDELDDHRLLYARRRDALVSEYATTDPAEFFAEGATYFLQHGAALEAERPRLYALLAGYFGFNPAAWTAPSPADLDPRVELLEKDRLVFEIAESRRLLEDAPESAETTYELAALVLESGDLTEGLALYARAFALGLEGEDYVAHRAQWMMAAGEYEAAEREFTRALDALPRWVEVRCDRARLRRWMGDDVGARTDLDEALRLDPESDLAYVELGLLERDLANEEAAVAMFEKALVLHPEAWLPLGARARAYEALGRSAEAAADRAALTALGATPADLERILREVDGPVDRR